MKRLTFGRITFFCIALSLAFILPLVAQDLPSVGSGSTNAPKTVKIRGVPERGVFVSDEPIVVHYYIQSPVGFKINDDYTYNPAPFTVITKAVGEKTTAKGVNIQALTVVVSLTGDQPNAAYVIPPLEVRYEYDEVIVDGDKFSKKKRSGKASSNEIKLEKVSIFVETDTLHEVVHIGDKNTLTVSVHVDSAVELMNDLSPEKETKDTDVTYLSSFSLEKPFALLARTRVETPSASGRYRIVTYAYTYSILDIKKEPYQVPVPPIVWRMQEDEPQTIAPSPASVTVRSILEKKTPFEPQKGIVPRPADERTMLLLLPFSVAIGISFILVSWGFVALVQFFRNFRKRKIKKPADAPEEIVPKLVYETSLFARMRLRSRVKRALYEYNTVPSEPACGNLRELFARRAVSRLKKPARIDRTTAVSMTATELRNVRDFPEIEILAELEQQLETGTYRPILNRKGDR